LVIPGELEQQLRRLACERPGDGAQLVAELRSLCLGTQGALVLDAGIRAGGSGLPPRQARRAYRRYQPVAERLGRAAVGLVVGVDGLQDRLIAGLAPLLVGDDAVAGGRHLLGALIAVERLQVLERDAGFGRNEPLLDDTVEVDEALLAQELVK